MLPSSCSGLRSSFVACCVAGQRVCCSRYYPCSSPPFVIIGISTFPPSLVSEGADMAKRPASVDWVTTQAKRSQYSELEQNPYGESLLMIKFDVYVYSHKFIYTFERNVEYLHLPMYMCSFGAMHAPPANYNSISIFRDFSIAISCTPPWPSSGSFGLDLGLGRVQDFAFPCALSVPCFPRSCQSEPKLCFWGHRGTAPVRTL